MSLRCLAFGIEEADDVHFNQDGIPSNVYQRARSSEGLVSSEGGQVEEGVISPEAIPLFFACSLEVADSCKW